MRSDKPTHLLCELTKNALAIESKNPRFSWRVPPNKEQSGYQIEVTNWQDRVVWDSDLISAREPFGNWYQGEEFEALSLYRWRVRILDSDKKWSLWSEWATFETGFSESVKPTAQWIRASTAPSYLAGQWESGVPNEATKKEEGLHYKGIYLSKKIQLPPSSKTIKRLRAYVTGLGVYQLYIEGKRVGDYFLHPATTDYNKRVYYDAFDLDPYQDSLERGCDVTLFLGNGRHIALYGFGPPQGFLQIMAEYEDQERLFFCSDLSWSTVEGPIKENSLFNGESYDSRVELNQKRVGGVELGVDLPLYSSTTTPITITSRIEPKKMWRVEGGYLFDFGQNFSGFVEISAWQPKGTQLSFHFAENINEDGTLNPASNRRAEATDRYIANGEDFTWHPVSTYHGFRYLFLTGYVGVPTLKSITGLCLHNESKTVGNLTLSESALGDVHQAILWGLRSNMVGIPTDSPQRDERHGWLGDALLSVNAALLNFEVQLFYEKFLLDIIDTQKESGAITDVAPKFWMDKDADPAWASAFITIAWALYWYRGDTTIVERVYPFCKKYIDFLLSQTEEGIVTKLGTFGDWCAPGLVTSLKTGLPYLSTWYLHHDLLLLEKMAKLLEKEREAFHYQKEAKKVQDALVKNFWNDSFMKTVEMSPWDHPDQTSQAMALAADLLDKTKSRELASFLHHLVVFTTGDHVGTGIHGTRYLLEQLSRWGYHEKAYDIATQSSYPGWLYMVKQGATTLWERWEHMISGGMISHNHIMFGSIDQWYYEYVVGLVPLEAGYREIGLYPAMFSRMEFAKAEIETPYGKTHLSWRRNIDKIEVTVEIPYGTVGRLFVSKVETPKEGVNLITSRYTDSHYEREVNYHYLLEPGMYCLTVEQEV